MQFIRCTYEEHAKQILDIFNDAILHSTALVVHGVIPCTRDNFSASPRAPQCLRPGGGLAPPL